MTEAAPLLLLKVSVLLATVLFAARVLRRAPAARRHGIWSMAFSALLALPLLAVVLPALRVPIASWPSTDATVGNAPLPNAAFPNALSVGDRVGDISTPEPMVATRPRSTVAMSSARASEIGGTRLDLPSLAAVLTGLWVAGAAAALVALLVALGRVGRMSARARALDSAEWREAVRQVSERLGVRRAVRVLAAEAVVTPLAGGIIRPTVFVPLDAATWDAERRQIVLAHEIAHLASGDPLRKLVSRIACTLYWFHPLVWLAQRQAITDCEQACDETVLALGVRPSTYARVLLDFADAAPLRVAGAMLPIVRRAHLEERLMAILHPFPRPEAARRGLVLLVGIGALTFTLAAARPVSSADGRSEATETMQTHEAPRPISADRSSPDRSSPEERGAPIVRGADPAASAPMVLAAEPCWDSVSEDRTFSGSMSMSGTTILEQIGWRGGDRIIRTRLGDVRLCMISAGLDSEREDALPSEWIARADRVVLETERGNDIRQMGIAGSEVTWTVGGQVRPVDAAANEWRAALLAVLDPIWELARLRGAASTLRGEISTIRGERSTLRGEISTLRGEVSTMRGEISTLRGHVSTLRGEISTIRGHESTLRGTISTERGAISTLRARQNASGEVAERIRRHEEEIRRIEAEITRYDADARVRAVERELADFDVETKVADLERQIREFDLNARTAAIERQISDLDVERRIEAIQNEIEALDVPGRSRELEQRRDAALARLRDVLR
jgi:beta-lactamase regulating signal transducer with metallopeptidase domain/predicted  nucleic acid-binding Zn-ribbon protein